MEQQIRQKMISGARWIYICWTWMFSTLCMSPMFGARKSVSNFGLLLTALFLIFIFLPWLLKYIPSFLLLAVQLALWIAVSFAFRAYAAVIYLIIGLPLILSEEMILSKKRAIPFVSLVLVAYFLAASRDWNSLILRLEAVIILSVIVFLAYKGIYRQFLQAEELRQVNIKLNEANKKVADLTAERVQQEIARDLHDTLTQNIIGINMQLSVIEMLNKKKEYKQAAEIVEKTQQMATDSIKLSRKMIKQYRNNEVASEISLKETVQKTIDSLQQDYALQTTLTVNQDVLLRADELADIDRVIGEALMNVVKHGKTDKATVKITVTNEQVVADIINHGKPWKLTKKHDHYGLTNMEERVAKYNGKIEFHPLDKGLKVTATFDIKEEQ